MGSGEGGLESARGAAPGGLYMGVGGIGPLAGGGGSRALDGLTPYAGRATCHSAGRTSCRGLACTIRPCRPDLLLFRARPWLGQAKIGRASCRLFSSTHLAIYTEDPH
jgi:hypothetical protein